MAHFAKQAASLAQQMADVEASDELPAYESEAVRQAHAEAGEHNQAVLQLAEAVNSAGHTVSDAPNGAACSILLHHHALLRIKRCLLVYQNERSRHIRALRWRLGSKFLPNKVAAGLSASESKFLDEYDAALRVYTREATGSLGLSLSLDPSPPRERRVEVRVLKRTGPIATADGELRLEPGSLHLIWREDAQYLQARGLVQPSDASGS